MVTVLLMPVVTVLAGPLSPGVKFGMTPGVLAKTGGDTGGAVAAAAGGAGKALVEVLQLVIDDEADVKLTTVPLSVETAGCGTAGANNGVLVLDAGSRLELELNVSRPGDSTVGGRPNMTDVVEVKLDDKVRTMPLSVVTTAGGGVLVDEVEELYT